MLEFAVSLVFAGVGIYLALGLLFAVYFVSGPIHAVDDHAPGSGIGFRLMIIPGVAALWPVVLLARARAGRAGGSHDS